MFPHIDFTDKSLCCRQNHTLIQRMDIWFPIGMAVCIILCICLWLLPLLGGMTCPSKCVSVHVVPAVIIAVLYGLRRDSYRAIGLYWVGSFLMGTMVYILGNAVGKNTKNNGGIFRWATLNSQVNLCFSQWYVILLCILSRKIWEPSHSSLRPPHALYHSVCLGLLPDLKSTLYTRCSVNGKLLDSSAHPQLFYMGCCFRLTWIVDLNHLLQSNLIMYTLVHLLLNTLCIGYKTQK